MSAIEDKFGAILWCNEATHDKVWGYFYRPTDGDFDSWGWPNKTSGWNCCIFWARRGKALRFKADKTGAALRDLVKSKRNKGYQPIDQLKLFEIWPTFVEEAESKLMWEVLSGKVK